MISLVLSNEGIRNYSKTARGPWLKISPPIPQIYLPAQTVFEQTSLMRLDLKIRLSVVL